MILYYYIICERYFIHIFFYSLYIYFLHNFITNRATPENLRNTELFVNFSKNNTITRGKQGSHDLTKNAK